MRPNATPQVTDLISELFGRLRAHFATVAAELDLTAPQMGVLKTLDDRTSMGKLAAEMGCDASNITWMTDRLEERGLVERRPDPSDRRVKQLVLTDAGKRLRRHIDRRLSSGFPGLDKLSSDERKKLAHLLEQMLGGAPVVHHHVRVGR